jgi:hypothetical protein
MENLIQEEITQLSDFSSYLSDAKLRNEDEVKATRSFSVIVANKSTGEILKTYSYKQVAMSIEDYQRLVEN